jgi:hypothetical protein
LENIFLTFHAHVSEERREKLLSEIGNWPGVEMAAPLKRNGPASFRRFSFARVDADHVDAATQALRALPEVEKVEVAPQRGIA